MILYKAEILVKCCCEAGRASGSLEPAGMGRLWASPGLAGQDWPTVPHTQLRPSGASVGMGQGQA